MTTVNAHLVWPLLVRPTLFTIHQKNATAARTLAVALAKAENTDPGFLLDMINTLHGKDNESSLIDSLNLTESLLRAQGRLSAGHLSMSNLDDRVQQLVERTSLLKKLLSRIPDEIQRTAFLQTIKEIASSIKKILDSLDALITDLPTAERRPIEQRKRQLVKNSKLFCQTLKCHFNASLDAGELFTSAVQLIYDANQIEKAFRLNIHRIM